MKTQKQTIKQKIVATVVVLFMIFMLFGSLDLPQTSAAVTVTNLLQNVVAGGTGLSHEALQNVVFPDITVGTAANSLGNLTQTNVWDLRGSGAGWSVTGIVNNLTTAGGNNTINILPNTIVAWNPAGGAIIAISGSGTGVTAGTAQYLNSSVTLITATASNGMGNYRINNVSLNIVYNGRTDQKVGAYTGVLIMTSS
jgi:hypothetical protein